MSDPYVPTTEEVREYWALTQGQAFEPEAQERHDERAAAFDRWLESLLATAGADGWDAGRAGGIEDVDTSGYGGMADRANPFRADSMGGKAHDQ